MATLGETRRGGHGGGRWEAASARPAAVLGGLVSGYSGFHEQSAQPVTRRELPAPGLTLVVSLAEPLSLARGAGTSDPHLSHAALVGVGRSGVRASHPGSQSVLEVQLSPLAATALFDVGASAVADQIVDLANLLPGARQLVERLSAAITWPDRFQLVETFLIVQAERGRAVDPVLTGAWQRVLDTDGDLGMHVLHDQTGWSRKRLAEHFRADVGLPPKAMAGLVRFDHAVHLLRRPGHRSLAAVALTCGYYDQAHLNREFRALAGCTPTEFLAGLLIDAAGTAMTGDDGVVERAGTNVQYGTDTRP